MLQNFWHVPVGRAVGTTSDPIGVKEPLCCAEALRDELLGASGRFSLSDAEDLQ